MSLVDLESFNDKIQDRQCRLDVETPEVLMPQKLLHGPGVSVPPDRLAVGPIKGVWRSPPRNLAPPGPPGGHSLVV